MPTFRKDIHLGHDVPMVESDDIVLHAVTEEKLDDNSVSTRTIQDNAVTTPKLDDEAVTTPKIDEKAVTTPKIADEAVTAPKLDDGAVTEPKITDGAVSEPKIRGNAVTTSKIKDKAVTTPKINNKAVTPEKVSDDFVSRLVSPLVNSLDEKYRAITQELYNMVASLQVGGIALSDRLGDREDIGITQKALTEILNGFNERINDIAGEWSSGFSMTVSPDSFISLDSATVNISASTSSGKFEHIAFYINNVLVSEADQVSSFTDTAEISETSEIKCVATMLGVTYIQSKVVTKFFPFFIGGGNTLEDVLIPENAREYDGSLVGSYDVDVEEGQKIFVLVPTALQSQIVRLDMNGYEIPVTITTDENNTIYESQNVYQEGTYNIDITDNSN